MKVAYIDGAADQRLHVTPHVVGRVVVGQGVTQPISGTIVGPGTTSTADGYVQGIITGVGSSTIDVKVVNRVSAAGTIFPVTYTENGIFAFTTGTKTSNTLPGPGLLISGSSSTIADPDAGISTCATVFQADDWYDNQFIQLKNGALQWKEIAEKPGTSGYAAARNGSNDELHIVVIDDSGKISGTTGAILEKFTFLSKADDAKNSFGDAIYYKNFIAENSDNIFVGICNRKWINFIRIYNCIYSNTNI